MHSSLQAREDLVAKGYIRKDVSDDGSLVIYTYTDSCTFEGMWNDVTRKSRGHIFNVETGECIGHPFDKFWNLGESYAPQNIDWKNYQVYEKMDGWLGTLYRHDNKFHVASRGSFHSPGATWASSLIQTKDLSCLPNEATLVFEIINKDQKIILEYEEYNLYVLAAFNRFTGEEYSRKQVEAWANQIDLPLVKLFDMTLEDCMTFKEEVKGKEGFVIRLADGNRVKIKTNWYCSLAKILSHLSPISIWEAMQDGKVQDIYLSKIPEEVLPIAQEYQVSLEKKYWELRNRAMAECSAFITQTKAGHKDWEVRKLVALNRNQLDKEISGAVFCILDNKLDALDKWVMQKIYPKGNQL